MFVTIYVIAMSAVLLALSGWSAWKKESAAEAVFAIAACLLLILANVCSRVLHLGRYEDVVSSVVYGLGFIGILLLSYALILNRKSKS